MASVDGSSSEAEEDFGQTVVLTKRIKGVLRGYPEGKCPPTVCFLGARTRRMHGRLPFLELVTRVWWVRTVYLGVLHRAERVYPKLGHLHVSLGNDKRKC